MKYAYGVKAKNENGILCPADGLVERLDDPTDSFWEILLYDKRLDLELETKYQLEYLGDVNE